MGGEVNQRLSIVEGGERAPCPPAPRSLNNNEFSFSKLTTLAQVYPSFLNIGVQHASRHFLSFLESL